MESPSEILKMILEVTVIAVGIYLVLRFLRETRGAGVLRGLSLILIGGFVGFGLLIDTLGLDRLSLLFSALINIAVLGVIIVFHPEIRLAIAHLGESPIFGQLFRQKARSLPRLLRGVARLSKDRVGALIAIERDGALNDITASGVMLDAQLNSYLVESIFARASPLHDGAIVIRENRIVAAKCLLPLSENQDINTRLGTRHRAAVGLTEESDALAIVVSEETGRISTALGGKLSHDLTLEELEQTMDNVLGGRI